MSRPLPSEDPWLDRWLGRLRSPVLELGCGQGLDAARMTASGLRVVALDRSAEMLETAVHLAPEAQLIRGELGRPLPFRDGVFGGAVASLSLHYLPWRDTLAALEEIHRVLAPGSVLVFRVNATDDYHHGAGAGEEVEPGLYVASPGGHAELKRFFDDEMVRAATGEWFEIEHLEHTTTYRFEQPKRIWECVATRRQ